MKADGHKPNGGLTNLKYKMRCAALMVHDAKAQSNEIRVTTERMQLMEVAWFIRWKIC